MSASLQARRQTVNQLVSIAVKQISFSYHVKAVFDGMPLLQHGNDGLIYTCVNTPYSPGTDKNMYVLDIASFFLDSQRSVID